jgi:hypothetical protein
LIVSLSLGEVITVSCIVAIVGDARPSSADWEFGWLGESLLLSMVLESVLVAAVPATTMGDRSWLTCGQEEGSVLDDNWLLMFDR